MTEDNPAPKKPSHYAYQVSEGQDGKSHFNRIGAAFENKDGQGYNILLDSVPVDGRVTLRTPQERLEKIRTEPRQKAEPERKGKAEPQQDHEAER